MSESDGRIPYADMSEQGWTLYEFLQDDTVGFVYSAYQSSAPTQIYSLCEIEKKEIVDLGRLESIVDTYCQLPTHPNVVSIHSCFQTSDNVYLISDFVSSGQITGCVHNEQDVRKVCRELVSALQHLHAHHLIHGNIHTDRVHVTADGIKQEGVRSMMACIQTCKKEYSECQYHLSPEYIASKYATLEHHIHTLQEYLDKPSIDVFSLGVVLSTLLFRKHILMESTQDTLRNVFKRMLRKQYLVTEEDWSTISSHGKELLLSMIAPHPKQRPSLSQILSHPW